MCEHIYVLVVGVRRLSVWINAWRHECKCRIEVLTHWLWSTKKKKNVKSSFIFTFTKVSPTFPAAVYPDRYNTFYYNQSLNGPMVPSCSPPLLSLHSNPRHVHIPT